MATSTASPATYTLETDDASVVYDVRGPLPPAADELPLFMVAQPMDASGFATLAGLFGDRTVITYDPRNGVGRTVNKTGRVEVRPEDQTQDIHAVILAVGGRGRRVRQQRRRGHRARPGCRVPAGRAHPGGPRAALDRPAAGRRSGVRGRRGAAAAVPRGGWGAGMAGFIGLTSWQGEFTDAYLSSPAPDPAQFGLPTEDDGNRGDPLLSGIANAITAYRPDVDAVTAAPTRVVIAAGVESRNTLTWRTFRRGRRSARSAVTEFPSHHGGFLGPEFGQAGQPEAFAARLHEVLAED